MMMRTEKRRMIMVIKFSFFFKKCSINTMSYLRFSSKVFSLEMFLYCVSTTYCHPEHQSILRKVNAASKFECLPECVVIFVSS